MEVGYGPDGGIMYALLTLALACSEAADDSGGSASVTFVDPLDGDSVPVGTLQASVIVEGFLLQDPSKHNEGAPEGYLSISVDGTEVLQTSSTVFEVQLDAVGSATLGAELRYTDGDALEPGVVAEVQLDVVAGP
jgi:hypothetical protein